MTDQNQQSLLLGKIAAYTELLIKDPTSTIFVSLAETYRKMGMVDDSRQIISKGLQLHPDFSPAYTVLARSLCQLEDFEGSVKAFERALDLDDESLAALVGYARVQILLENEVSARELLLRARKLSPADPVINKLLLSIPVNMEVSVAESEDNIVQSDAVVENPATLVSATLAELYLAQGATEKALDLFRRLSEKTPDDLTLRRRVKELEEQLSVEAISVSELPSNTPVVEKEQIRDTENIEAETVADPVENPILTTLNYWISNIQKRRGNV